MYEMNQSHELYFIDVLEFFCDMWYIRRKYEIMLNQTNIYAIENLKLSSKTKRTQEKWTWDFHICITHWSINVHACMVMATQHKDGPITLENFFAALNDLVFHAWNFTLCVGAKGLVHRSRFSPFWKYVITCDRCIMYLTAHTTHIIDRL